MAKPTLTISATDDITPTTATANGAISDTGAERVSKRGFVISTTSHADPGNVGPSASGYEDYGEEIGNFVLQPFDWGFTALSKNTLYYVRAYAKNPSGYSYSAETSFTTLIEYYPTAVYPPRTKLNKIGADYRPQDPYTLFAPDITKLDDEVVAIENELGIEPKGPLADVSTYLAQLRAQFGYTLELAPGGDGTQSWRDCAVNYSGQYIIVCCNSGRIYTSADYGETWTERQPAGNVDKAWYRAVIDSDGSFMAVCASPGRIYISTDYGVNWSEVRPNGDADFAWRLLSCDNDGSFIVAGVYAGRLYTSANTGSSWTERQPAGAVNLNWWSSCCSSNGSTLYVGVRNGRLYKGTVSGATWAEIQPIGAANAYWMGLDCNTSGARLVCADQNGRAFTSGDSGANFIEMYPNYLVTPYFLTASMSNSGEVIAIITSIGRIYVSANYGRDFREIRPVGNSSEYWSFASLNGYGTYLFSAGGDSKFFKTVL